MKKFYVLLLTIAIVLGWVFSNKKPEITNSPEKKFAVIEQKSFVLVIPSYNNEKYCVRNLNSVFEQEYRNYRVIYIDDASTDNTYEAVKDYVEFSKQNQRVVLIRNKTNLGAMENLYRAIKSCRSDEIIVTLDGDDWLPHDKTLSNLNKIYANPDIWMTYGSFVLYPSYQCVDLIEVPEKVWQENKIRNFIHKTKQFPFSHIRTFYKCLFDQINLNDFLFRGKFFPSAYDAAIMVPLAEMCGPVHTYWMKEIGYVYNRATLLNDDKLNANLQSECAEEVYRRAPYACLSKLPISQEKGAQELTKADVIVFSYDRPMQLLAFLESFYKFVANAGEISVIYRSDDEHVSNAYNEVGRAYPKVNFIKQSVNPKEDFKSLTLGAFKKGAAEYIVFAVDDVVVKEPVDFNVCASAMAQTKAYGFYLRLGKNIDYTYMLDLKHKIPFSIPMDGEVFAWQFEVGKGDWKYPNSLDMTVYKKVDILDDLTTMDYHNPNTLEGRWAARADLKKTGLYFERSKIVNIPLNLVNQSSNRNMQGYDVKELLALFNQGLKIDITPICQLENCSAHVEIEPQFISRDR